MEKSNIDEKIKLLTGSGMWHTQEVEGLPSVHLSDGPHGLRKQEEKERQNNVSLVSTCYPTASAGLFVGCDRRRAIGKGGCEGSMERGRCRAAGAGHQHEAFPPVRQKF